MAKAVDVNVTGSVPLLTQALKLEELYTAIRLDDPAADLPSVIEETLAPGFSGWLGPTNLSPRVDIQRYFMLWGDPCVRITFGIDTQDRTVGPFYLPPSPAQFEFYKYYVKSAILILRENTDAVKSAESHIIIFTVQPLATDWKQFWLPRLMAKVKAMKGV